MHCDDNISAYRKLNDIGRIPFEIFQTLRKLSLIWFLPPAYEVRGKVCFQFVCIHGGGGR